MDKHLKALAPKHLDTKFIKLDAEVNINKPFLFLHLDGEFSHFILAVVLFVLLTQDSEFLWQNAPFFVTKLAVKTLPCVIIFRSAIS